MKQQTRATIASVILVTGLLLLQSCEIQESDLVAEGFNINKPLAYVKRPVDSMVLSDPRTNAVLAPGGNLYLHDLGNPSVADINVTAAITAAIEGVKGAGDVMSINTSYDGSRIVFAMHEGVLEGDNVPENTWDIWELLLRPQQGEAALRRVIPSDLVARNGNDLDPVYLPDGRIVFTSDRQVGGMNLQIVYGFGVEIERRNLDETRTEPALNLHIMTSTGDKIKQISYNQSDDRFPSILHTGEVVFSRWERAGNTESRFDLYQVNPDGSEMKLLYGSHSHLSTVNNLPAFDQAFYKPRQMADGRLVALLMPYSTFDPNDPNLLETTAGGGEIVIIDYASYSDVDAPRANTVPLQSPSGHISATSGKANTRFDLPLNGRFASPFPIWGPDGSASRFLISMAYCKVSDPADSTGARKPCKNNETVPLASPEYGLFYLDSADGTLAPVLRFEPGMVLTDAVIMSDRTRLLAMPVNAVPVVLVDKEVNGLGIDTEMAARNFGAIKIRSVYDALSLTAIGLAPATRLLLPEGLPCTDKTGAANNSVLCDDTNENIVVDIARLADPAQTTADQRPVHYVRVVGAMPSFEGTQRFSFGTTGTEMRAILGYAPVEPDGSVFVEVPANVPFALELVDKQGRKFRGSIARRDRLPVNAVVPTRNYLSHDNWLQVIPGETLECNGCHEGHSGAPPLHGGAGNELAYTLPIPYINTVSTMVPNLGETMAETRVRLRASDADCTSVTPTPLSCRDGKLQRDMIYRDVWTDAALAGRPADSDYAIEYHDRLPAVGTPPYVPQGLSGNAPIFDVGTAGCQITDYTASTKQGNWTSECRIVIDYPTHIQPLWDMTRMVDDGTGTNTQIDRKCTICHSMVDAMDAAQIPAGAGQLDLTSNGVQNTTSTNGNRNTSYQELLFTGKKLILVGAEVIVDQTSQIIPILDANGNPVLDANGNPTTQEVFTDIQLNTGPVVRPFFARESYLIETMTGTELKNNRPLQAVTIDHTTLMTRAEIRVITEWIEMGVQYFNNPGVAP